MRRQWELTGFTTENAIAYGQVSAAMMAAAFDGQSKDAVIDSSLNAANPDIKAAIEKALSGGPQSLDSPRMT